MKKKKNKASDSKKEAKPQYRFGIAEWYGESFVDLSARQRREYAALQQTVGAEIPECPFLSSNSESIPCHKIGGVCSLRSYEEVGGRVSLDQRGSTFRITCPSRFEEEQLIYNWIGEVILQDSAAVPIGQVNFLERTPLMGKSEKPAKAKKDQEGVGRIDNVLVVPGSSPIQWCPVEIQAVYFSGSEMLGDFRAIAGHRDESIPFPAGKRRPDYRSSGPKRLMPQLQIKVPTLRRWGKKMAVVVDEDFIGNTGKMNTVTDLSNCDVAWFVVRIDESSGAPKLARANVFYTQLEAAIEGLIAGKPVTQSRFEERISEKLQRAIAKRQ